MKANQSPYSELQVVSTGFGKLDQMLGLGGVPLRKLTEISGKWSVGKSTLALQIVAHAQKQGLDCLWVDDEISFTVEYAESMGVDCATLELIQATDEDSSIAEYYLDATEEWVREHKNALVVLDSIGGLVPRDELEKKSGERVIGGQAKLIATFCRKIVPMLAINNVGLIVLNHDFTDLMTGTLKTSGGEKLGYHKSLWLHLRKAGKRVMKGEDQVGEIIQAEIRKNKLAPTLKQTCDLTMMYGQGFSAEADLLQELLDSGEVTKKGNTYFRGETKLAVGLQAAREALKHG